MCLTLYKRCYPPNFGKVWDGKPLPIVSKERVQEAAAAAAVVAAHDAALEVEMQ